MKEKDAQLLYISAAVVGLIVLIYYLYKNASTNAAAVTEANSILASNTTSTQNPAQANQQVYIDSKTGQVVWSGIGAAGAAVPAAIASQAASGVFLGLSAAAWTGIGAAVAGAIALVYALRSTTHLKANELVSKYENPFGQFVIRVVSGEGQMMNAGTLTKTDALAALAATQKAWSDYKAQMFALMTQGPDWVIVAKQSLNNLDNMYKGEKLSNGKVLGVGMGGAFGQQADYGFMSTWIDWMTARVNER